MQYGRYNFEMDMDERLFVDAYFDALYFTDTGDMDQPDGSEDLDADFIKESIVDCLSFFSRIRCYIPDGRIVDAAHDFWFTRNGHGVGFWEDGRWPSVTGQMFDERARGYGCVEPVFDEVM